MIEIHEGILYNHIFTKAYRRVLNCHPVHAVLSDDVKADVKSIQTSPDSSLGTTFHYFSHM